MRLVIMDDIQRDQNEASMILTQEDSSEFDHGGKGDLKEFAKTASKHGFETVFYYKGFKFLIDDIVFFSDRQLLHFHDGWRLLQKEGMLGRTIAVLIESDVVDRKCGQKVLKRIRNAFPAFLTYQDDLIDNNRFFKIWPSIEIKGDIPGKLRSWNELDLASIITTKQIHHQMPGEKYSERIKIVNWFEDHPEYGFKVFGRGWDGYRTNGGVIKSKYEAYGNSKFAFCIENCRRNGYITEKIFDCFENGTVPVYLGAPNVSEYIPKNCFIDHSSFDSIEELVKFLTTIDEEKYNEYLSNIREFLKSDLEKFTIETPFLAIDRLSQNEIQWDKPDLGSRIGMFFLIREYERYLYYKKIFKHRLTKGSEK